jgi:hypothetical protein
MKAECEEIENKIYANACKASELVNLVNDALGLRSEFDYFTLLIEAEQARQQPGYEIRTNHLHRLAKHLVLYVPEQEIEHQERQKHQNRSFMRHCVVS